MIPAVALRRFDAKRNMARFYAVAVQPTLFDQWAVVRRWGRVNTDGRRAETWFEDLAAAVACANEHTLAKLRRGYSPAPWTVPSDATPAATYPG